MNVLRSMRVSRVGGRGFVRREGEGEVLEKGHCALNLLALERGHRYAMVGSFTRGMGLIENQWRGKGFGVVVIN